jgi:hypothetical protein
METLSMETQSAPGMETEGSDSTLSSDERTYTLPEAAELAGTSIGTLWTLIRDRRLAANVKPGSYGLEYRIRADALAGLQNAERPKAPAPVPAVLNETAPEVVAPRPTENADLQAAREAAARAEARAAELERLVTALESHIADLRGQLDSANDSQTSLRQLLAALQAQLIRQR